MPSGLTIGEIFRYFYGGIAFFFFAWLHWRGPVEGFFEQNTALAVPAIFGVGAFAYFVWRPFYNKAIQPRLGPGPGWWRQAHADRRRLICRLGRSERSVQDRQVGLWSSEIHALYLTAALGVLVSFAKLASSQWPTIYTWTSANRAWAASIASIPLFIYAWSRDRDVQDIERQIS